MINEAKYRSPKWLRNYIDFEVNTGDDVSDEKSKKQLRKEWDKRWEQADRDQFLKFYSNVIKGEKSINVTNRELDKVYNDWRGDMSFWDKFDEWRKDLENKQQQKQKLKRELYDLYIRLIEDWNSSPYLDKISSVRQSNSKVKIIYTFEDGDTLIMKDNKIKYHLRNSAKIYTVGLFYKNKFVHVLNKMMNNGGNRPNKGGYKSKSKSKSTNNKYSSHPKGKLYHSLLDTIIQREEQLRNMSKNDPDRKAFENELKVAKDKLENLKSKYKFENLFNFNGFNINS